MAPTGEEVEMVVRVYRKREAGGARMGLAFFFDCLTNNECEDGRLGVVELSVRAGAEDAADGAGDAGASLPPRLIHLGDVLRVRGVVDPTAVLHPPRTKLVECAHVEMVEPWEVTMSPQDSPTGRQAQPSSPNGAANGSSSGKSSPSAPASPPANKNRMAWVHPEASFLGLNRRAREAGDAAALQRRPVALLQCQKAEAERVAAYFNGEVATNNHKKVRMVYVYDDGSACTGDAESTGGANLVWRDFLQRALSTAKRNERCACHPWAYGDGDAADGKSGDDCSSKGVVPLYLHAVVQRVFLVTAPPKVSLSDAAQCLRAHHVALGHLALGAPAGEPQPAAPCMERLAHVDPHRTARVQTYPKVLEGSLKDMVDAAVGEPRPTAAPTSGACIDPASGAPWVPPPGVSCPANIAPYDSLCYSDGFYWIGCSVPRLVVPEERVPAPCKAYWKLWEVRDRYLASIYGTSPHPYTNRSFAVDVGASPGGWSYCLAKDFGAKVVLSIDPAPFDTYDPMLAQYSPGGGIGVGVEDVLRSVGEAAPSAVTGAEGEEVRAGRIVAVQEKGDEALPRHVVKNKLPVALFVSDMNWWMEHTVDLAESVRSCYERPALVVLTLKNKTRGGKDFEERKAAVRARLSTWLSNVREMHLFANTQLETTIVGEMLE